MYEKCPDLRYKVGSVVRRGKDERKVEIHI